MRVLVFEFASAGGFGTEPPASIRAEGRAMRDAACRDLLRLDGVDVVAASSDAAPVTGRGLGAHDGEPVADFIRRAASGIDAVWPIAPESSGIGLAVTRAVEATGCINLGSGGRAVALASSKSRTLARLAKARVTVAPTWPLAEAPLEAHAQWVLKPDVGCGCEGARRLSRAGMAARRGDGPADGLIAQPWLAGRPMSLSLRVWRHGTELLSVNEQHIDVERNGSLSLSSISRNVAVTAALRAELESLAQRVAAAIPGLSGFVGIDFVIDGDGRPMVLEVNPRLTSAYVGLSSLLRRNVAGDILRDACDE